MKKFILSLTVLFSFYGFSECPSLLDHEIRILASSEERNLCDFEGKVILAVNVASQCGYTYQYESLQKLYSQYKNFNFVIIGFPSNDFLWQEPGSNDQIADFCEENYGVTFPMMSKITVKGSKKHPIYQFLTQKSKNNYKDSKVTWNFQKYLINKDGKVEKIIAPKTRPDSEEIVSWITNGD